MILDFQEMDLETGVARRLRIENTNPKKVYCIDHALIASVSSAILVNSGHLLENLVFTALRRRHAEIHYYRTRTGREVDFVVPRRGRPPMLVQACESLADPRTRKRETAALAAAMAEPDVRTATVVTRNERERIEIGGSSRWCRPGGSCSRPIPPANGSEPPRP